MRFIKSQIKAIICLVIFGFGAVVGHSAAQANQDCHASTARQR